MAEASDKRETTGAWSLRTLGSARGLGILAASIVIVGVVVFAIFRVYSDSLSDEFYELASENMNDYALTQRLEVQSSLRESSVAIDALRAVAESPEVDPEGPSFQAYLGEWNERGSYQVTYVTISSLEASLGRERSLEEDEAVLERLKAGETVVSEVRHSQRLDGYYFSIAEPIESDGRIVGVLRSVMKASELLQTSQSNSSVDLLGALLIKSDGTIVAESEQTAELDGKNLYDLIAERGVAPEKVEHVRATVESDSDASTLMLGKLDDRMTFFTSVRLGMNDWTIVNFTEESLLAEHSQKILSDTVATGALLVAISAFACLIVALVVGRTRRGARREAERYAVLSEFSDTVLFEYSYTRDALELTPNARSLFPLEKLVWEGYLARDEPFLEFDGDAHERVRDLLKRPAPADEPRRLVCRARVLNGEYRWLSFKCRYLYDGGRPFAAVGKIVDITQQKMEEDRLKRQSQIDGLTHVFNRSAVVDRIEALLEEDERGMLFVIDVDEFKQVNDSFSHSVGDRVLERVAGLLVDAFRRCDSVGRIGGDEFVAFVSGCGDESVADAKQEAIESAVSALASELDIPVSVSIGVALSPRDGSSYQMLFDAADRAMYEEKHGKGH